MYRYSRMILNRWIISKYGIHTFFVYILEYVCVCPRIVSTREDFNTIITDILFLLYSLFHLYSVKIKVIYERYYAVSLTNTTCSSLPFRYHHQNAKVRYYSSIQASSPSPWMISVLSIPLDKC
jgi:hypothetical protein